MNQERGSSVRREFPFRSFSIQRAAVRPRRAFPFDGSAVFSLVFVSARAAGLAERSKRVSSKTQNDGAVLKSAVFAATSPRGFLSSTVSFFSFRRQRAVFDRFPNAAELSRVATNCCGAAIRKIDRRGVKRRDDEKSRLTVKIVSNLDTNLIVLIA